MLGVFLRLTPPRFFRILGEEAHEFLTTCRDKLYTLGLVESRGENFTTYQLDRPARQRWKTFIESGLVGSPPMTWTEFLEVILAKFIPMSVRD